MGSNILPTWHPYKTNVPRIGQRANSLKNVSGLLTLAVMGDSITRNISATETGYVDAFNILTSNRFYYELGYNEGVAGNTTTQMVARLSDLNSIPFTDCFLMGGINDIKSTQSVSTILSNLSTIVNYITLTLGKRCILLKVLPNDNWGTLTIPQIAAAKANILAINAWIMAQHGTRKGLVYAVDTYTNFVQGDIPKAGYTYDGIHPATTGSYVIAQDIIDGINTWYDNLGA